MQLSPKTNPTKKLYKSMSLALDISQSKPKSEPVDDHALLLSESSMQEEENLSPEKGKLPLKNMVAFSLNVTFIFYIHRLFMLKFILMITTYLRQALGT